ncbi:MAG TPA: xanthine dehydrogenase family protein molybdopterin-binding subunit [Azospirillaceae bacterium]|nr:xanthine dehydrogenase family protein molybdopterin-binding subunit [Azospirillaceae bacterium]
MKFGIGQAVPRTEDARLLTGGGRYTDDIRLPGQLHGHVLRSPHAHARIRAIDISAARAAPGVVGIFTGDDLARDGIGDIPCQVPLRQKDGSLLKAPRRPALAQGHAKFVGDPVVFIVAETLDQAKDAAELVEVDYDPLPAVADPAQALRPGAAQVWDIAPANLCFDWELGDAEGVAAGFAKAARVVSLDLVNNRVAPTSMEGRAAIAHFDPATDRLTLYISSQGVHSLQRQFADAIFKMPKEKIRVVTTDVGGGFGMKLFNYPEYVCAAYASKRLGRPVRWTSDRSEAFLADDHGRDNLTHAELALDAAGRFLALKVETVANLGGYLSNYAPFVPTEAGTRMLAGCYTTPAVHVSVKGVFTNTAPVDAYRGAGRPEAAYCLERIVDAAAREMGLSPAEIRRRNFIPAAAMPYKTSMGLVYDSGDFQRNMEDALKLGDWDGFEARRREARARGKRRGIGLASYIEACAGGGAEQSTIRVRGDGTVTILIGTQSNGQGHETAYKQIAAERLGLAPEDIVIVQGDTDTITFGGGTGGSRSVPVGGAALSETAVRLVEKMKPKAADLLEAAAVDVAFEDGAFRIVGTDRTVGFKEVARAAVADPAALAFEEAAQWKPPASTFPNGTHVCEVEIDEDTGAVDIVRYSVVDDFGHVINPLLLAGQVHGGIVQGIGQALYEEAVYDPESGQLVTGSLMDYAMPRADHVPYFEFRYNVIPCTTNALGIKGAGEAGTIGATPAVINAIVDALADLGVRHVDMPATPQKLWRRMHDARMRQAAE